MNCLSRSLFALAVVILSLFVVHGQSTDVCDLEETLEIIMKVFDTVKNETSIAAGINWNPDIQALQQNSLSNETHYTILVPTNEAFDELAKANGLAEEEDLKIPPPVLRFHIIEGIALFGEIESEENETVESGDTFDTLLADTKIEIKFERKAGVVNITSPEDVITTFVGPYNSAEMVTTFGYDLADEKGLGSDCIMPVSVILIDQVLIPPNREEESHSGEDESPMSGPDEDFEAGATSPGGYGSGGNCYRSNFLYGSVTCVAGCGLTPGSACNNIVCATGCPDPSSIGMSTLGGGSSSASTPGGYSYMPSENTMGLPKTLMPSESSGSGYGINCAFGPCGGPTVGPTVGKISVPNKSGCASGPCVGKLHASHSYGSSRSVSPSKCLANNSECIRGPGNNCCSGICERPNGGVNKYNCLDY